MSRLGRHAAKWALELAGSQSALVDRDPSGLPLWPPGFKGSITHTTIGAEVFAVAAVTADPNVISLGVDLESLERHVDLRIWRRIVTESEAARFAKSPTKVDVLTVFTGKEAVYKALYPLVRRFVGFREVEIAWNLQPNETTALSVIGYSRPLPFLAAGKVSGEWELDVYLHADDQLLLASVLCTKN